MLDFNKQVKEVADNIVNMLIEKNKSYGNSALDPVRVFSKSDDLEQLYVRIDDKLSRIKRGNNFKNEDVIDDLIGYLFIVKIKRKQNAISNVSGMPKKKINGNRNKSLSKMQKKKKKSL